MSKHRPFADLEFGPTVQALMFQHHESNHLVATRDDALAGYLGWLLVDPEGAEAWVAGKARLMAKPDGTAIAVTLFATQYTEDILPMITAATCASVASRSASRVSGSPWSAATV